MHDLTVLAHDLGPAPWSAFGPLLVLTVVPVLAYVEGLRALGGGHLAPLRHGAARLGRARVAAFAGGLAAVWVALLPLDVPAGHSFAGHMTQHMVLIVVAAPLLAAGAPGLPLTLALPHPLRRRVARWRHRLRTGPTMTSAAWFLHMAALWGWHLPAGYEAALRSETLHLAEHVTLFGTAWLLWTRLVSPERPHGPGAAFGLFATALPSAALGAVLTFAPTPLYPLQAERSREAGIAPLFDQQLAGLVMWVPADVVYFVAMVAVLVPWLRGTRNRRMTGPPGSDREPVLLAPGEVRR